MNACRPAVNWNETCTAHSTNGEFELFYQPDCSISVNNKIKTFEALLRWRHPRAGPCLPDGVYSNRRRDGPHCPAWRMGNTDRVCRSSELVR